MINFKIIIMLFLLSLFNIHAKSFADYTKVEQEEFIKTFNTYEYYNQAKNGDVEKAINICNTSAMLGYRIFDKKTNTYEEIVGEKLFPICKIASNTKDVNSMRKYAELLNTYDNLDLKKESFNIYKELVNNHDDVLSYSILASFYTTKPFFDLYKAEKWYQKAINTKFMSIYKAQYQCSLSTIYFLYPSSSFYNLRKAKKLIKEGKMNSSNSLITNYCKKIEEFFNKEKDSNKTEINNNNYYNNKNSLGGF
ncbi:hypothetical protein GA417_05525 [Poseidonibacter ostreae]|uniref:hypothetical protein n=1 Tax=Poseidonibacter ostreae TaxID=2654171 RepID=UPI001264B8B0|nr:hypothetical protein [Poseidonibacter ostreae]KAB7886410.1 hypothetical protein GA417_05525 [Poseidonibacter ostreae]